jgi:hypothetical protein
MNDAHAYEMQVQMWKPNTWVLQPRAHPRPERPHALSAPAP